MSSNGLHYTKLDKDIIYSSLWAMKPEFCKVWITILALKNREQMVTQNVTGMARIACLPLAVVEEAIAMFESPDPQSTSKEEGGRKLIRMKGGWLVVNGEAYEGMGWSDEKREWERNRKSKYRDKKKTQSLPSAPNVPRGTGVEEGNGSGLRPAPIDGSSKRSAFVPATVEDLVTFGLQCDPKVTEDVSRKFWFNYEATAKLNPSGEVVWEKKGGGIITNWRAHLQGWAAGEFNKPEEGVERAEIDPRSDGYRDPKLKGKKGEIW